MENRHLSRGKRVDNGEWVEGFYCAVTKGAWLNPIQNRHHIMTFKVLENGEIIITGMFDIDPATLGSCTGLKDKNGKLIFEGDVVKVSSYTTTVFWDSRIASFGLEVDNKNFITFLDIFISGQINNLEIIGNIHDTPTERDPDET